MYLHTKPYEQVCPYNELFKYNFPEVNALKGILLKTYRIQIKYTPRGMCPSVIVNGHNVMWRKGKFGPVVTDGAKIIYGTPQKVGGSNRYPYPTFEEGYAILELECYGFPNLYEPSIELLSISIA